MTGNVESKRHKKRVKALAWLGLLRGVKKGELSKGNILLNGDRAVLFLGGSRK